MPTTLNISITHRVGLVWMTRAEVRNAFNETTIAELTDAFRTLGADPGVRAIVLAAEGPAFCAGADLEWMRRMSQYSHDENLADATKLATMLRTIHECPKPVIARVHGAAFAGGVGLVAACDIAVASLTAEFCLTETKLGLIPATIAPYVIRAMGPGNARRYFLTAEKFDAGEAFRIGLVQDIVAPDELDGDHQRTARRPDADQRGGGDRSQAPGPRPRVPPDRRRPRRRHGGADRGHPPERGRPRRDRVLPREAQAALGRRVRGDGAARTTRRCDPSVRNVRIGCADARAFRTIS